MTNEDGDPITLETVHRPRRRREKKLMTMDEVNDKFPMTKYKTWVSERAREGLPTAGGVSVSPSRANSIHEAEGILPELAIAKSRLSTDAHPANGSKTNTLDANKDDEKLSKDAPAQPEQTGPGQTSTQGERRGPLRTRSSPEDDEDDDQDDEHIDAALPPECLAAPGDSCAICIDTLEDDDDVRGLICGHAFHAGCVDPWLTSRRACCPLCKADYYTAKPRPNQEGDANSNSNNNGTSLDPRNGSRLNLPGGLRPAWLRYPNNYSRPSLGPPPHFRDINNRSQGRAGQTGQPAQLDGRRSASTPAASVGGGGMLSSIRQALGFGRHDEQPAAAAAATPASTERVTPSQLESGTRATAP
ncbi:hypothetical protein UVI_02057080 [Ustilaginoidea virens]|nr:hypothetical protein UVI_02057080 [Ustilaginoidea virens]